MGLKVGDFTIMRYNGSGVIGHLSNIDDNMTTLKWSYDFNGGQSYHDLQVVENSVKKIPNRDIKKVGSNYYMKEECEIKGSFPKYFIHGECLERGNLLIRNRKTMEFLRKFYNRSKNKKYNIYIIYKLKVCEGYLDVTPFKIITKKINKPKEKIKINI